MPELVPVLSKIVLRLAALLSLLIAAATMTATGVDETTSMILEYASGAQAVLTATLASPRNSLSACPSRRS